MKILNFSDLCWEPELKKIDKKQVETFNLKDLKKPSYKQIEKYFSIINEEKPDLVLFAGDITGDGSCGRGYQNAMKILLKALDVKGISSFFISGNHDESSPFNELIDFANELKYSKDISNQFVTFQGIRILGIPFDTSNNKAEFKELIKANSQKIDIVLCHAELKRRTWLFDLNTDFVITGHVDQKLTPIEDKVFISLENDCSWKISYCTLIFDDLLDVEIKYIIKQEKQTIELTETLNKLRLNQRNEYFVENGKQKEVPKEKDKLSSTEILKKRKPGEDVKKLLEENESAEIVVYLRGENYKEGIERIRKIKNENQLLSESEFKYLTNLKITSTRKVSRPMIEEYLGRINFVMSLFD